jgi:cystathionine gamma-lyase
LKERRPLRYLTKIVHAGEKPCPATGAIVTPIYQTATYVMDGVGKDKGYDYSRHNHPTRRALELKMAALEGGVDATCFSSGMAAIDALMHTLEKGDHVLACDDLYGGTKRLFSQIYSKVGIVSELVDMTDPSVIKKKLRKNTKMIFIETPSNPMLKIIDIKAAAKAAKDAGIHCVVDNTFMTPYFQRPLELGADIVVHSLTKYLSGHNDLIGGAVVTSDKAFAEKINWIAKSVGNGLGPQDSYLTIRGIKTLGLRMRQHNDNAVKIARFLEGHKKVSKVIYPGLESHPQHALAKKQATGFGGMISFELKGGLKAGVRCMESVKVWLLAESLGGVESMVTHPYTMTHKDVPEEQKRKLGITEGLVRLSVGIEDADDLIEDLDRAIS